ncbi:protein kinase domain-containing protein [Legionella sp. D16C41]|uniref:protein kinase domain-containing protein n=1 Tax=Legionella sp. D16C41 TaxID=3402688 RepID=UPI003AF77D74
MQFEINLNAKGITGVDPKDLANFFEEQTKAGVNVWIKGEKYCHKGHTFTFKNDIYQRTGKHGIRYEVISNKAEIGQGASGTIKLIKCTVSFKENDISYKKESKKDKSRRIVKIQKFKPFEANNEYKQAKKAPHLAMKQPVTAHDLSKTYTTMKQLPGKELQQVLKEDLENIRILTIAERFKLCRALLLALKKQVTDQQIIHRDIKPRNILVDLGPPIIVNIVDYGLSISKLDGKIVGTEPFIAPEIIKNPDTTSVKSDIYSMGQIFALIWRLKKPSQPEKRVDNQRNYVSGQAFELADLFFNIEEELDKSKKKNIYEFLTSLLENNPEKRIDIDTAIANFSNIDKELDVSPPEMKDNLEETQFIGKELNTLSFFNKNNFSQEEDYRQQFLREYKKLFSRELPVLRKANITDKESLAAILKHAIETKKSKSRKVCVKLGWLNKYGELATNAPDIIKSNYPLLEDKPYALALTN